MLHASACFFCRACLGNSAVISRAMNPEDRLFGEIAIKLGMVRRAEFGPHLEAIRSRPGEIGAVLLEAGVLDAAEVKTVMGHLERILHQRGRQGEGEAPRRHSVVPPPQPEAARRPPANAKNSDLGQSSPSAPFLDKVLTFAVKQRASDVHLHSGAPLLARIAGKLSPIRGETKISPADAEKMIAQVLTPEQWRALADDGQVDFAYAIAGVGRFRVNAYRQQGGTDCVFRVIPDQRQSLSQLGLPETLKRLTDFRTGLVLCTGPAGSGKSTTLAALLDAVIETRKEHVITLEDPIEHVFRSSSAWVNQRQVRRHTESFGRALRAALREDPDVIAITELRDRESISLALSAAETGHLVLATVNTNSAGQTINRIVNAFPGDEQGHVRNVLSESLRAVVSQRLIHGVNAGERVVAVEILIVTTAVANLIRDNKTFQLPSVMQTGTSLGMVTMDNALLDLVAAGKITREQAQRHASAKERFR